MAALEDHLLEALCHEEAIASRGSCLNTRGMRKVFTLNEGDQTTCSLWFPFITIRLSPRADPDVTSVGGG